MLCDLNKRRTSGEFPRKSETLSAHEAALAAIQSWDGYEVSPVIKIAGILVKNETNRFGTGSFKALGAGVAVDGPCSTASAGNHGVAVAWAARRQGVPCRVYLSSRVTEAMAQRIQSYGATVVRSGDTYEESLKACQGGVQDKGDTPVVRAIHAGYSVIGAELLELRPTHVVVNAGVGGFAAALTAYFWAKLGDDRPKMIVVEPTQADCLRRLATDGSPTLKGNTVQTGLDCHEACPFAWPTLRDGAYAFCAVPDSLILPTMRVLDEHGIEAGESGVAGLALMLNADDEVKRTLAIDATSRVVVIVCEAPPDRDAWLEKVRR